MTDTLQQALDTPGCERLRDFASVGDFYSIIFCSYGLLHPTCLAGTSFLNIPPPVAPKAY